MSGMLARKTALARLSILWERLWAALWPGLPILAFAAAIVLSGLLGGLPGAARLIILAVLLAAILWGFRGLAALRLPAQDEALRRIESRSNLAHRPVTGATDTLANPVADPASVEIWRVHKLREWARLKGLKAGWPRSVLARLDGFALRLPAALALIAALVLAPGDPAANLADAVRLTPRVAEAAFSLDAWIKPPAYTGRPPLMLTSPAAQERIAREGAIEVPEGSTLVVRASGAKMPKLMFSPAADAAFVDVQAKARTADGVYQAEAPIAQPGRLKLTDGTRDLAEWPLTILPDLAPTVSFQANPAPEYSGALAVKWKAADDYGIAGIAAKIALADVQDGALGIAGNGVFLFDPPEFPVIMKKAAAKEANGTSTNDLTAHPWAGFTVDMTLEARDAAGKTGTSETKTFVLPERAFRKPLAQALIEQRKELIADPGETAHVQLMIGALLAYPDGLIEESGVHLGMRLAHSRLVHAEDQEDVKATIALLWEIAVSIEDGELASARAELEEIRKQLQQALAEGAPPERIAELMQKLREAMNRYMESMAEETRKAMREGSDRRGQEPGRMIKPEDLQKMMDQIENLARNGANEAAQEMLSQLENLLRNLQPGMQSQMEQQGESPMSEMLDELSELMRRQQQLMDDTNRLEEGDPSGEMSPQDGQEPGMRGAKPGALADQQQALGRMLEEMMRRLGEQGMQSPPSFGDAGKSMEGAEGALRQGRKGQALGDQGEAMQALREGAQNMARQLMQQGMGNQGNYGRHGEARGDDRDPLGRPLPTEGEDYGPERDMVPGEIAIRRAREILEMLRSRSNDPARPRLERDYLDRLLKGLY